MGAGSMGWYRGKVKGVPHAATAPQRSGSRSRVALPGRAHRVYTSVT